MPVRVRPRAQKGRTLSFVHTITSPRSHSMSAAQIGAMQTSSPAGAGPVLALNRLLLAPAEAESGEPKCEKGKGRRLGDSLAEQMVGHRPRRTGDKPWLAGNRRV